MQMSPTDFGQSRPDVRDESPKTASRPLKNRVISVHHRQNVLDLTTFLLDFIIFIQRQLSQSKIKSVHAKNAKKNDINSAEVRTEEEDLLTKNPTIDIVAIHTLKTQTKTHYTY